VAAKEHSKAKITAKRIKNSSHPACRFSGYS